MGDLVVENTAAGGVTAQHSITGYSEGQLLAMAAALGFVLGLLLVRSVKMRRPRRVRRRQLGTAERELTAQLAELERDNASCARSWPTVHRLCAVRVRLPCQPSSHRRSCPNG